MNDFLPDGYKTPVTSNYMKFQADENKFRVLSKPIVGWEYWVEEDGKRSPRRVRTYEELPAFVKTLTGRERPKHFWAMVVWNYQDSKIQILEITQGGIQKSIETLASDEDWGTPLEYDLVVKKEGDGLDTEYQTNPKPKKDLHPEIVKAYKNISVELEALYQGKDPFAANEVLPSDEVMEEAKEVFNKPTAKPIASVSMAKSEKQEEVDTEDLPF